MDITRRNFDYALPILLNAIAGAHFVAIDLEFSGIPGRQIGRSKGADDGSGGKQTLQQRYEETKRAAETYQVLQMGITCVSEDEDTGMALIPRKRNECDLNIIRCIYCSTVQFLSQSNT